MELCFLLFPFQREEGRTVGRWGDGAGDRGGEEDRKGVYGLKGLLMTFI